MANMSSGVMALIAGTLNALNKIGLKLWNVVENIKIKNNLSLGHKSKNEYRNKTS